MMAAESTSVTSVNFYQTTRRYNPEQSHLHTHRRGNLKSYMVYDILTFNDPGPLWLKFLYALWYFRQVLFMSTLSSKFYKDANLFGILTWYCSLICASFCFFRTNLCISNFHTALTAIYYLYFIHRPYILQPQRFKGWFFPRHQVKPILLGPVDRASLYLIPLNVVVTKHKDDG
jgi:hypothetical protein